MDSQYGTFSSPNHGRVKYSRSLVAAGVIAFALLAVGLVAVTLSAYHTPSFDRESLSESFPQSLSEAQPSVRDEDHLLETTDAAIEMTEKQLSQLEAQNKALPSLMTTHKAALTSLDAKAKAPSSKTAKAAIKQSKAVTKKGQAKHAKPSAKAAKLAAKKDTKKLDFTHEWEEKHNKLTMKKDAIAKLAKEVEGKEGKSESKLGKAAKKFTKNLLEVEKLKDAVYKKSRKAFAKAQMKTFNAKLKDIMTGTLQGEGEARKQLVHELVNHYNKVGSEQTRPLVLLPPPMHDQMEGFD